MLKYKSFVNMADAVHYMNENGVTKSDILYFDIHHETWVLIYEYSEGC